MGMYTQVFFTAEIDYEAGELIQAALTDTDSEVKIPDNIFFTGDWRYFFRSGGSAYFHGTTLSLHEHRHNPPGVRSFDIVMLRDLKNYCNEIELFFDWIKPHVKATCGTGGFIGYSLYEEQESPTLYFVES